MADIQHSAITDPQIHEPKGASTASVDTVYVSNGAGSGAWQKLEADQLDQTSVNAYIQADLDDGTLDVTGQWYVNETLADVSSVGFLLVPVLKDCTLLRMRAVVEGTLTTADATLTMTRNGVDAMGTLVIVQAGAVEGTGFTFTPSGNAAITGPGYIKVASDGGSDTARRLFLQFEFEGIVNTP